MPESETITIGRGEGNSLVLPHLRVSRRHAVVSIDGAGHAVVRDLGSTHGTYVSGERIARPHPLRADDVIGVGPYNLLFDGHRLCQDERPGLRVDVSGLTRRAGKRAIILRGISLSIEAGEFVAIAGESGAGKTSLLRALLGLDPIDSGLIAFDGAEHALALERLRGIIGYVSQENHLRLSLPLQRALHYVARLRCAADVTDGEIRRRSADLLRLLRLEDVREQPVRTLSTGELRRANLAAELLCLPTLLLLDEPTSGLDPHLRLEIVKVVRGLAPLGVTVVMVSHEASEIQQADRLAILVKGGSLRYFGAPAQALAHFGSPTYEALYALLSSDSPRAHIGTGPEVAPLPGDGNGAHPRERRPARRVPRLAPALLRAQLRAFTYQLRVMVCQYGEVILTDVPNLAFLLLQAPLIGIMIALVSQNDAFSRGPGPFEAQKTLFFVVIAIVWFGVINSLREISKEQAILRRERIAGMSVAAYLLSKFIVLGVLCLAQTAVLLLIVLAKTGTPPRETSLYLPVGVELFVGIALAGVAAIALGLCVSAFAGSSDKATSIAPLILLPQIIFAGVIFLVSGPTQVPAGVSVSFWAMRAVGTSVNLDHLYYAQLVHIYPLIVKYPALEMAPSGPVPPFDPQDYDSDPRVRSYTSVRGVNPTWNDAQATRRENLAQAWIMLVTLTIAFGTLAYIRLRGSTGAVDRQTPRLRMSEQLRGWRTLPRTSSKRVVRVELAGKPLSAPPPR